MEQEMEYAYAVYQEGTISRAAEKLFLTQPALSMALRRLEGKLGESLFDRSRNPLRLTAAGEIFIEKCRELKILEQEMKSQIDELNGLGKGTLTVGGTHFILSYVLAPMLVDFAKRYPGIKLNVLECSSKESERLLLDGAIDFYLRCSEPPPSISRISYAFSDQVLVAVPRQYIKEYSLPDSFLEREQIEAGVHKEESCPNTDFLDLAGIPFLKLADGHNLGGRLLDLFAQHDLTANIIMEVEQLTTSFYLADSGLGATLASTLLIEKSKSQNLVFYKVDTPLLLRQFYFVARQHGYISRVAKGFMELLD